MDYFKKTWGVKSVLLFEPWKIVAHLYSEYLLNIITIFTLDFT